MAYLAKIPLNPLRRGAQHLLTHPQRMHAAVEGCLPPRRSGRLLWRLETLGRKVHLLVLSPDWPNFDHLVDQAGWPGNEAAEPRIADLAPLMAQIAIGRPFQFRLKANTVRQSRQVSKPTAGQSEQLASGKRVLLGQRTAAYQLSWLTDRASAANPQWGFTIPAAPEQPAVQIIARDQLRFSRRDSGMVSLDTATFDGTLVVTDAELMRRSLVEGLGKGKAYGCGLLTLAPPRG